MQSINLINCIQKGLESKKNASPVSYHGWAMNWLNQEGEWEDDRIHVSDYSTQLDGHDRRCPRQLWLRYHGADRREPKLGEQIMWDQGREMQYRYTWTLEAGLPEDWFITGIEHDLSDYLPNEDTGHADLILESPEQFIVVEVKTQRGRAFQYLNEAKKSHVLQLSGYVYALRKYVDRNVLGVVLYLDREGQNRPVQFAPELVEPSKIEHISDQTNEIVSGKKPPILQPQLDINENKGPDSIYLKSPWQCDYCDYEGVSCPGALEQEFKDLGIVAKRDNDGKLSFKEERVEPIVRKLIHT